MSYICVDFNIILSVRNSTRNGLAYFLQHNTNKKRWFDKIVSRSKQQRSIETKPHLMLFEFCHLDSCERVPFLLQIFSAHENTQQITDYVE